LLTEPTKTLKSERVPIQLPAELLPALARQRRVLLCLDYDGTIFGNVQDQQPLGPFRVFSAGSRRGWGAARPGCGCDRERLQKSRRCAKFFTSGGASRSQAFHGLDFEGSEEIMQGARTVYSKRIHR
jgi:hypothetical protein